MSHFKNCVLEKQKMRTGHDARTDDKPAACSSAHAGSSRVRPTQSVPVTGAGVDPAGWADAPPIARGVPACAAIEPNGLPAASVVAAGDAGDRVVVGRVSDGGASSGGS